MTMMNLSKRIMLPVFLPRLLALAAAVSATLIMVTSHDSTRVLGLTFEAKFTNSPTFMYFVLMNAIASGYTFVLLFVVGKGICARLILVSDLIMTLLLDSSISSCLAIGQVGKNGNSHAGWVPICGQVPKFCDHVTGALIAGFIAAIVYFFIVLLSLHSAMNLSMHNT